MGIYSIVEPRQVCGTQTAYNLNLHKHILKMTPCITSCTSTFDTFSNMITND